MKKVITIAAFAALVFGMLFVDLACKKDSTTSPVVDPNVATYPVRAQVHNPQGQPQALATLTLANPPSGAAKFTALTDSTGWAQIEAPAGAQTLIAKIGTVFQATMSVNVAASSTPTVVATPIKLVQNASSGKVLVVKASAEQLEDVLHVIGYNTFDSVYVSALRDSSVSDSTALLTWLKQYKLIFSDCDGASESYYPLLARVYGRYVEAGGKIYGGHYNYYNLQNWLLTSYKTYVYGGSTATDTLQVVDATLASGVGTLLDWTHSADSRHLSGYERFSDIPASAKIYGVIYKTSPAIPVIVENYPSALSGGKYLWTDYHNQDIKNDPVLIKIVQYFLLNM